MAHSHGARATPASTRLIALALGAAVLLVAASFAFLMRDRIGGPAGDAVPAETAVDPNAARGPDAADEMADAAPAPLADPAMAPRDTFLTAMADLQGAKSPAAERAAMERLQDAASRGHPPAQLQLGEFYKLGQIVERDLGEARVWYRRAADGGNVLAMHRLGVMSARGEGGPVDLQASINWFEQAAGFGLVDSMYNLGATFHPTGDEDPAGVQDRARAYYWYSLAAKNGDDQAQNLAEGVGQGLSADARAETDAEIAEWTATAPDPVANERPAG